MKIAVRRSRRPLVVAIVTIIAVAASVFDVHLMDTHFERTSEPTAEPLEQAQVTVERIEAAPEVPMRITIDKIDVDAVIEQVGLTDIGLMDDPKSNELVGWYHKSAKIGEDDFAVLLDGHYGIGDQAAVFRRLPELTTGDEIVLHGEDGADARYHVIEMEQQYTEDVDMRKALYPYGSQRQSLTIITCEGEYDPARATYDRRTIVYAVRIDLT